MQKFLGKCALFLVGASILSLVSGKIASNIGLLNNEVAVGSAGTIATYSFVGAMGCGILMLAMSVFSRPEY